MMIVMQIWPSLKAFLSRTETWTPLALRGVRVLLILACAWLLTRLAARLLAQLRHYAVGLVRRRGELASAEIEMRAATIVLALRKLANSAIWVVALVMSLQELNYKIEPLLAGLGIAGLRDPLLSIN